jgi:hypothetical protein
VTGKELLEAVANGKVDVVELLLGLLRSANVPDPSWRLFGR